jgi:Fe-coproporphyrin III synthase
LSYSAENKTCSNLTSPRQQQRTVQIHPTLWCNLLCQHCYSSSGPSLTRVTLDQTTLLDAITDVHKLGYRIVSFSGGEPLLYNGLENLLSHAKSLGMKTSVTTNGTVLNKELLGRLKDHLDLLAISLDGPPSIHNEIRGSQDAFDRLLKGLENVKSVGLPIGFIHTLTRENWEHLLWVAEFAANHHASLLQIHPLELHGRAELMMGASSPDDDILARVYIITLALASKYEGIMRLQFDAFRRDYIINNPELVYGSDFGVDSNKGDSKLQLADLLNFLVIDADGTVVPIAYGFSKRYMLCNINKTRLYQVWPHYLQDPDGYWLFRKLCKEVYDEISTPSELPFFNWYELVVKRSNQNNKI